MTTPRFIRLIDYNVSSSELTFEATRSTAFINNLRFFFEFDVDVAVQLKKDKDIITLKPSQKLGDWFIELFLAQIKLQAVELYGEEHWVKFVEAVREKAGVKIRFPGITVFKSNLFNPKTAACLIDINKFLDVRSLAVFQTVAFGSVPKDQKEEKKRDFTSMRQRHFSPLWKQYTKEHYPPGSTQKMTLTQCTEKPLAELDYNESYFASNKDKKLRLIIHSTITGNITHPVMRSLTLNDILSIDFTRRNKPQILPALAKQYNQSELLHTWWKSLAVPFFRLDDHKFDLNKTFSGYTILDYAVYFHQIEIIPGLLAAGADPAHGRLLQAAAYAETVVDFNLMRSMPLDKVNTPLVIASERGNLPLTTSLLKCKANPNSRTSLNETPLLFAAWNANTSCVLKLLEAKADCKAINNFQETALHWAVENTDLGSLDALLKQQVEEKVEVQSNPLLVAAKDCGNTPFHLALIQQKEQIANRLLQTAALNIDVLRQMLLHTNEAKQSSLTLAAAFPTLSMLKTILSVAERYEISFPNNEIETTLEKVKTDLTILKLLEKIVKDLPLKQKIAELRKTAQDAFCRNTFQALTVSSDSSLFPEDSKPDGINALSIPK